MNFRWLLLFVFGVTTFAQTPNIAGDYNGVLGPLHLKLHLKSTPTGGLEGTLDSVDQGANGLPCANFHLEKDTLSFDVPSVGGKWHGSVSSDGATLSGNWSQGSEMPLVFRRAEASQAPAAKQSPVDGIWLGTLDAGDPKLRIQLHLSSNGGGKEEGSLDSLDQGAMGLVCEGIQFDSNHLSFEVPIVHGHWSGTLSANGGALDGVWSQGKDLPLQFKRQASAISLPPAKPPKFDAEVAPVPVSELKGVLDRDLADALKQGALAPSTGGGVAIGVVQHGVRRIFVYGAVKEDSIFEIGSISKTFTGLILAQMVEQHKVRLDEPVRELLPQGTVAKPDGPEITLLDLATQHSGLPRMPDNFHPANPEDPYEDYRAANLYEFIAKHGLKKPADAGFNYSNLGVGLLGQALSNRAGTNYPDLLHVEITGPLTLNDTAVKLSPEQEKRFAQGHDGQHHPAHAWSLDALAGAGAIRSTAADMLTYLEAQLHPDKVKRGPEATSADSPALTMSAALQMSHELRADALPDMKIALAWLYKTKTGTYWHNGATGGYSSYAFFNPKEDYAAVVLSNTSISQTGSFADLLGEHIGERLAGKPAISLGE
ncbi:MAG: beta-lactamase family protein [Acidobacteriota bacterium]|nr:beta-lactamase family protein [Acidobacteriota bacterium]